MVEEAWSDLQETEVISENDDAGLELHDDNDDVEEDGVGDGDGVGTWLADENDKASLRWKVANLLSGSSRASRRRIITGRRRRSGGGSINTAGWSSGAKVAVISAFAVLCLITVACRCYNQQQRRARSERQVQARAVHQGGERLLHDEGAEAHRAAEPAALAAPAVEEESATARSDSAHAGAGILAADASGEFPAQGTEVPVAVALPVSGPQDGSAAVAEMA